MTEADFDLSGFTEDERRQIFNRLNEEKAEILRRRELSQQRHTAHLNNVALLRIAADYLDWLYINGRGSTFSTFGNEFGFDSMLAKKVFEHVGALYNQMSVMIFPVDALYSDVDYPKPPYSVEDEDD